MVEIPQANQRQALEDAIELATLAGLFAGEGFIMLQTPNKNRPKQYPTLRVGIGMTELCWPERFRKKFGGVVYINKPKNQNCKWVFLWRVSGKEAEFFLRAIQSFLYGEKVPQLELALAFQEEKRKHYRKDLINTNLVLWETFFEKKKALRFAAAETNRRDAHAAQSDSPILQEIAV